MFGSLVYSVVQSHALGSSQRDGEELPLGVQHKRCLVQERSEQNMLNKCIMSCLDPHGNIGNLSIRCHSLLQAIRERTQIVLENASPSLLITRVAHAYGRFDKSSNCSRSCSIRLLAAGRRVPHPGSDPRRTTDFARPLKKDTISFWALFSGTPPLPLSGAITQSTA